MNEKEQILIYLEQIKDETPLEQHHESLKFLECENVNKDSKRVLRVV